MQLEVEQKYPVANHDEVQAKLLELGCQLHAPLRQVDLYFAHPARDFAQTDEALRLRRTNDDARITYKGPKLDAMTKTRREIELPLAGENAYERHRELLTVLGFREVREVRKLRTPGELPWEGTKIEVALDDVDELGTFIELERLAGPDELEHAKQRIAALAARLGLQNPERRGYLDLLLRKQAAR
jgi:adenylate cyclase class 2